MGQANKKKRDCPAAGRVITPAECGANRASAYACPSDCPHNPWGDGHYDQALAIDTATERLMIQRLVAENGGRLRADDEDILRNGSVTTRHYHFIRRFQLDRDKAGRNFFERWEADKFAGLKNDEINLLRWKTQSRIRLLEFWRVGPREGWCEAVDLLDPARGVLRILDRSMYRRACRFKHLLTWTHEQPHYTRILGLGLELPPCNALYPDDIVRLIVGHLDGPTANGAIHRWIADHFIEMTEAMTACGEAIHQQLIKNMGLRTVTTIYRLRDTLTNLMQRLDSCDHVEEEQVTLEARATGFLQCRLWLMDAATEAELVDSQIGCSPLGKEFGKAMLGTVLCGLEQVQLESSSVDKARILQQKFEELAGNLVSKQGERVVDTSEQLLAQRDPYNKKLVPPEMLRHVHTVLTGTWTIPSQDAAGPVDRSTVLRKMDESFLEMRVPNLKQLTPREAANNPEVRPMLIRLIKDRVSNTDQQNLQQGTDYDCNWMIKELGLTEILIDPPPPRSPPAEHDANGFGTDLHEPMAPGPDGLNMSLPPSPTLPPAPLSDAEVERRYREISHEFKTTDRLADSLINANPALVDTLHRALPKNANDDDFAILLLLAAHIWAFFVPTGTRGWSVNDETFRRELALRLEKTSQIKSQQAFKAYILQSRQPAICSYISELMRYTLNSPKTEGVNYESYTCVVVLLMMSVLIDELDKAARPNAQ